MAKESTPVEALLKRDRVVVITGLVILCGLSWWWIFAGAGTGMDIGAMSTLSFPPPVSMSMNVEWTIGYSVVMFFMWWVMMVAMMTPSAAPAILLFAHAYRFEQRRGKLPSAVAPTFVFAAGYLVAWAAFSLVAVMLQWGFEQFKLVHAMKMWSIDRTFSAVVLMAAAAYQLSPLKEACLNHCRTPAQFIAAHFRLGQWGAFSMGLIHGGYCVGCCWFLMALLFVGGIMNILWIAGLAILVLAEKLAAWGRWIARVSGLLFGLAGAALLLSS